MSVLQTYMERLSNFINPFNDSSDDLRDFLILARTSLLACAESTRNDKSNVELAIATQISVILLKKRPVKKIQ